MSSLERKLNKQIISPAPTATRLQQLIHLCECYGIEHDMVYNPA